MEEVSDIEAIYPWLTTKLFTRIVQKVVPDNIIYVQKYTVKAALAKGENFGSQMLRATVTYTTDVTDSPSDIRFIIKAALSDANLRAVIDESQVFQKEIVNFEYILPEVYRLLESVDDHTKLSAA